jgi:hypothetical protein
MTHVIEKIRVLASISHRMNLEILYPYSSTIISSIKNIKGRTARPPGPISGPMTISL